MIWSISAAEQALVADLTGHKQRRQAYGLDVMCSDLDGTIGPLVGPCLYQTFSASAPFYASGAIIAACTLMLVAFLGLPNRTRGYR